MDASLVTLLILRINSLIDSGKYNDISFEEIHQAIENKSLLRFLTDRCGEDAKFKLHLNSPGFEAKYEERLNNIYNAYAGDEKRKWAIQNSGLCLVLAWTNEIIQQHFVSPGDPQFALSYD